jgi:hypothetical protein
MGEEEHGRPFHSSTSLGMNAGLHFESTRSFGATCRSSIGPYPQLRRCEKSLVVVGEENSRTALLSNSAIVHIGRGAAGLERSG